jgi:glutathione S-transferase
VFDEIGDFGIFAGKPKLAQWRSRLRERPSIRNAVSADYNDLLRAFLKKKGAWLSQVEARKAA